MKILYVSREYYGRRVRYGKVLRNLGHTITTKTKKITSADLEGHKLILIRAIKHFDIFIGRAIYKEARARGIQFAYYGSIKTSISLKRWAQYLKYIDYPFIMNKHVIRELTKLGIKAKYSPMGYYADQYYPRKEKDKPYDVTFMGHLQGMVPADKDKRAKALNKLLGAGIKLHVWGKDVENRVNVQVRPYSTHKVQNKIYNRSKINLDLPWINSTLPDYRDMVHMKNRFMEIPGSGSFMLTKRCAEFEDIFQDGVHCAYYDSHSDMVDKVKFYLRKNRLRKKIALAGYKRVQGSFQFKHVLADVITGIQQWEA